MKNKTVYFVIILTVICVFGLFVDAFKGFDSTVATKISMSNVKSWYTQGNTPNYLREEQFNDTSDLQFNFGANFSDTSSTTIVGDQFEYDNLSNHGYMLSIPSGSASIVNTTINNKLNSKVLETISSTQPAYVMRWLTLNQSIYDISLSVKVISFSDSAKFLSVLNTDGREVFGVGFKSVNSYSGTWEIESQNLSKLSQPISTNFLEGWHTFDITLEPQNTTNTLIKLWVDESNKAEAIAFSSVSSMSWLLLGSFSTHQDTEFDNLTIERIQNTPSTETQLILTLDKPIDVSGNRYVSFWVCASQGAGQFVKGYSLNQQQNYSVSFYLYDANGNWKGWVNTPINWAGWREIVIPLNFLQKSVDDLSITNDYSQNWSDTVSLHSVNAIRLQLDRAAAADAPNNVESLSIHSVQFEKSSWNVSQLLWSVFYGVFLVSLLIVLTFFVLKRYVFDKQPLNSQVLSFQLSHRLQGIKVPLVIFPISIILNSILAVLTPLSSDFIDILYGATPVYPWSNILVNSPTQGGSWFNVLGLMFQFWARTPVDHYPILSIFPGNLGNPALAHGIWDFEFTPGKILLVFMMKFPNIVCTTVIGLLVLIIVLKSFKLKHALLASALWLFNPFTILMTSMWVTLDIASLMFLVLGILLLMKKRYSLSGLVTAISATIRPFSLIAIPFMLISVEKSKRKNFLFWSILGIAIYWLFYFFARMFTPQDTLVSSLPDNTFILGIPIQFWGYTFYSNVIIFPLVLVLFYKIKPIESALPDIILVGYLSIFAIMRWQPMWMIYFVPFLAIRLGSYVKDKWEMILFIGLNSTLLLSTFLWHSFYLSSWGNSVLFYPNANPLMQGISKFIFSLQGTNNQMVIGIILSLFSVFAILYVVNLTAQIYKQSRRKVTVAE
jgi:hypothetical protein